MMRLTRGTRILLCLGLVFSVAHAAVPVGGWKSLQGAIYLIHGGSLADRQVPVAGDTKLSIAIENQPAKEIFNAIGPDLPGMCSDEQGDRTRHKKGVTCSYTAKDKGTKEGPFRCWIGIDLKTGESVGTVSC